MKRRSGVHIILYMIHLGNGVILESGVAASTGNEVNEPASVKNLRVHTCRCKVQTKYPTT